ncbi:hypothetical protein TIFTF001_036595 [Ficus carica]|uniref:Uncharacterized protein n=1 Tax=Ficus carica TaxID=3494 RepID=A0AA88JB99_FICCA|nr:hypothetical protein TIFTF001_036595 [Ficus carica]
MGPGRAVILGWPVKGPNSVVRKPQELGCLQRRIGTTQTTGRNASGDRRSTEALSSYRLDRTVGKFRV